MNEIYSEIILDLYKNPLNKGHLINPNLVVQGGNPSCGDQAVFELSINNSKIDGIKFSGFGCAISIASESILTELVKGKKVSEAINLTEKDLLESLGGVIQTRIKCAALGLRILREALKKFDSEKPSQRLVVTGLIV
ncbi:MAG TPA: iron-sulfur cluster assembly scaffold protein [archaeon]|nr:iron-sulfur cluster assembly scaffold protein [archaeon]